MIEELNEDRRDALQEIINISFGRSVASLAQLLGVFIQLSIPDVRVVQPSQVLDFLVSNMEGEDRVSLVQQAFRGQFFGEALLALPHRSGKSLIAMLQEGGFAPEMEMDQLEMEALLEIGNIVMGACLGQLAHLLHTTLAFNPPQVSVEQLNSERFRSTIADREGRVLLIQTNFRVKEREVVGFLFIFFHEDGLDWVFRSVDQFLNGCL